MNKFIINVSESKCRTKANVMECCLFHNTKAYYHELYYGHGRWKVLGSIENLLCTLKNDITPYTKERLDDAVSNLETILKKDLKSIQTDLGLQNLRICVVPRSKKEDSYKDNQRLFRSAIKNVVLQVPGLEDGTLDILRCVDTKTTHRAYSGNGGSGELPYVGITKDTCTISDSVIGKDVLLIDDIYTKTVCIDEDCIQALYDKGARRVFFYAVGKTVLQ
ncbi:MAG: amidophosphoribosyltransferase [Bacteroidales bacterium]|nr:amidophosphoribosyltransferase [Bacteroidales bacterium]